MIQDRSFNADGSFRYRFDLDRGFRGDTILVNGAVAPRMKVERYVPAALPQRVQRARVQARAGQRAQDVADRLDGGLPLASRSGRTRSRSSRRSAST